MKKKPCNHISKSTSADANTPGPHGNVNGACDVFIGTYLVVIPRMTQIPH